MNDKLHLQRIADPVLFARFQARREEIMAGSETLITSDGMTFSVKSGVSYEKAINGLDPLLEKRFTIKDTDLNYRELNHWASLGLVDDAREKESREWRRLSFRDILWLKTLKELRDFGVSLESVEKIYQQHIKRPKIYASTAFDDAMWACFGKNPIAAFLIVSKSGVSLIVSGATLAVMERKGLIQQSHLRINLNALFCAIAGGSGVMPAVVNEKANDKKADLDPQTRLIMDSIESSKGFEEIRIRKKGEQVFDIELSKRVSGERVVALINEIQNGQIITTVENGKAVTSFVTKKKRIKK